MAENGIKNEGLTAKQLRAIEALLSEPTIASAAKRAKIGERTIFTWLNNSAFSAAYSAARSRLIESTLTALEAAGADAVKCLREVINDISAPVPARVSAAKAVLEISLRAREAVEIEARLRALEEKQNQQPTFGRIAK